jgi:hypothetical protein
MHSLTKTIISLFAGFSLASLSLSVIAMPDTKPVQQQKTQPVGLVMQPKTSLKSAPKDSARELAVLWQGEWVEVRDKRMDYLEVYDHKRERVGFVKVTHLRQSKFHESETKEFLTLVRYLRDTRGSDSLGISLASAYLKAASIQDMNSAEGAEVLQAVGIFADRIAERMSSNTQLSKSASSYLSQQLEVATQYGVHFNNLEKEGQIKVCYDGEVYRQVLALPANPEIKAEAALSLTKDTCVSPDLTPVQQAQLNVWRAEVIAKVPHDALPEYLKNRIEMRKASIFSALSYAQTRFAQNPEALKLSGIQASSQALMQEAMTAFSHVDKSELPDIDWSAYNNTAMLVNANRWALKQAETKKTFGVLQLEMRPGKVGETCVTLIEKNQKNPIAQRCTYSVVWPQSVTINRQKNAIALAVQPMAGWTELWLFQKNKAGWQITALPPAVSETGLGYVEFAGWAPNGKQILLAKESRAEGIYQRNYEVVNLASLSVQRQARDASILGAFRRWQDPSWKANSISLR